MALKRDSFRNIVSGITTQGPQELTKPPIVEAVEAAGEVESDESLPAGEGGGPAVRVSITHEAKAEDYRRFAKRGRPKGRKDVPPASKGPKVKVSLFLSEAIVNDLYDWAHQDRIHPGEMFERALKPFHEKEAKRRNGGKGE